MIQEVYRVKVLCLCLQVRAHYSLVSTLPCPALDEVCNEVNCLDQLSSSPVKGVFPSPGWCLRQWQKTIPQNYTSTLHLGFVITDCPSK